MSSERTVALQPACSNWWIEHYSQLAKQAMLAEVNLTPKPGLVDRANNGAHRDMTLADFYASAEAIGQWFPAFIEYGITSSHQPAEQILIGIRPIGMGCEQAMLAATQNVNTHKGSIFSLGLICAAIGRLKATHRPISATAVCHEVALFCHGMIDRELKQSNKNETAGQRLFSQHGLTGARGEAESGFMTVTNVSLPVYQTMLANNMPDDVALHQALIALMAANDDTNVASRGGIEGLRWLQQASHQLLSAGGVSLSDYRLRLQQLDQTCIEKNLSPGGSADLLILTWFLNRI